MAERVPWLAFSSVPWSWARDTGQTFKGTKHGSLLLVKGWSGRVPDTAPRVDALGLWWQQVASAPRRLRSASSGRVTERRLAAQVRHGAPRHRVPMRPCYSVTLGSRGAPADAGLLQQLRTGPGNRRSAHTAPIDGWIDAGFRPSCLSKRKTRSLRFRRWRVYSFWWAIVDAFGTAQMPLRDFMGHTSASHAKPGFASSPSL